MSHKSVVYYNLGKSDKAKGQVPVYQPHHKDNYEKREYLKGYYESEVPTQTFPSACT
jgi:hypothetical protein